MVFCAQRKQSESNSSCHSLMALESRQRMGLNDGGGPGVQRDPTFSQVSTKQEWQEKKY